eukprot:TRINITY_DN71241_c0_g1_i1.p1 TRINITY_DN71241_c0_g1~~TRINITY_DN71241_c0_g1_i1.p1  ORF type:complete len:321 (-),score=80.04 TRINITY_DN71241_c0_g1_i1:154-1077(-)
MARRDATVRWKRPWTPLALALACLGASCVGKAVLKGERTLLWPIHVSKVLVSGGSSKEAALEPGSFGKELAAIGKKGFQRYLKEVLPKELQLDAEFAASFSASDHSRTNLAFKRWQMRSFAAREKLPIKRLTALGEKVPQIPGANYSWPEAYDNAEFNKLLNYVRKMTKVYLKRVGYDEAHYKQKFIIFPWFEVYEFGEAMRPGALTNGAYLFGRYFAAADKNSMKFNFEDPRGINPPYGKTHTMKVDEGRLYLLPSWVSTFMTPNMKNHTHVCVAFLIYPEHGKLPWTDDLSSDVKVTLPGRSVTV